MSKHSSHLLYYNIRPTFYEMMSDNMYKHRLTLNEWPECSYLFRRTADKTAGKDLGQAVRPVANSRAATSSTLSLTLLTARTVQSSSDHLEAWNKNHNILYNKSENNLMYV